MLCKIINIILIIIASLNIYSYLTLENYNDRLEKELKIIEDKLKTSQEENYLLKKLYIEQKLLNN